MLTSVMHFEAKAGLCLLEVEDSVQEGFLGPPCYWHYLQAKPGRPMHPQIWVVSKWGLSNP